MSFHEECPKCRMKGIYDEYDTRLKWLKKCLYCGYVKYPDWDHERMTTSRMKNCPTMISYPKPKGLW